MLQSNNSYCTQTASNAASVCRAKFDKFTPRLEDRVDPHTPVPFAEMFGQGVDDLIGGVCSLFLLLSWLCL